MSRNLENITGEDLVHLVSEIMARKGYNINIDPITYSDLDLLATKRTERKISKYFITISGRSTSRYLTKRDMSSTLPDPIELSDSSRLLIVTTCRSSSKKARQIATTDPTPKKVWYVSNLLEKIRDTNSEYLVDLYDKGLYDYTLKKDLERRFSYQGIDVSDQVIDYIVNETYHPRKIIAYVESEKYGYDTVFLENINSVENFKSEFSNY